MSNYWKSSNCWKFQIRTNSKKNQDWLLNKLEKANFSVPKVILGGDFHTVLIQGDGYVSYNYNEQFGDSNFGTPLNMADKNDLKYIKTEILKLKEVKREKQKFRAGDRIEIINLSSFPAPYNKGKIIQILNKEVYSEYRIPGRAYLVKLDEPISFKRGFSMGATLLPFHEINLISLIRETK